MLLNGIDVLVSDPPQWKSKRIGFLTNDAARTIDGQPGRVALLEAGFNIIKLFSPEHGIDTKGADGKFIPDAIDALTGLPVISLYGKKNAPQHEDVEELDILLFDIPDAGTRFYTYLWSMSYWIESGAKHHKKIFILDRPNPLGGHTRKAEGPMLDIKTSSFLGRFPMPITHGCTLGELALYFNEKQKWQADAEIIPCKGWKRKLFTDWDRPWIKTSPAIQSFEACALYPGFCFFEATNVSVGRGRSYSFEWIGAPWLDTTAFIERFHEIVRADLVTKPLDEGIHFTVVNPKEYQPVLTGLLMLKLVKDLHPSEFKWCPYPTEANPGGQEHLSLLMGIPGAEKLFDLPFENLKKELQKILQVNEWHDMVSKHLLYPNP
jgi:uncharacterized protein YbbC (DUF1343 family)